MLTRLIAACCCLLSALAGQTSERPVSLTAWRQDDGIRLQLENDSIGFGDTTDRGYTNGALIAWDVQRELTPDFLIDLGHWLPLGPAERRGLGFRFEFGQQMFTPEDIQQPGLIRTDRPYAGYLFGNFVLQNLNYGTDPTDDRLDTWSLGLGVVGPSSLADDVQVEWHKIVDAPNPAGWSNQLDDEFALQLGYRRRLRSVFDEDAMGPLQMDASTSFGGDLGNVHTQFVVGGDLRVGMHLPRDFGTGIFTEEQHRHADSWHAFLLAGVEGRAVLRNIFLDGNTFESSHDVDRSVFVADFRVGFELAMSRRLRLRYTHNFRTAEFDSRTASAHPQDFATVSLQWFF